MTGTIQAADFEIVVFRPRPGGLRGNQLRHLPTGMGWELRRRADQTTLEMMRWVYAQATRDLIVLGWEPDEDWVRRMAEMNQ